MRNELIKTKGVQRLHGALGELVDRCGSAVPGFALVEGRPGSGKSTAAASTEPAFGAALVRAEATTNLGEMLRSVCLALGLDAPPRHAERLRAVVACLRDAPRPVIVDEAERLLGCGMALEALRDVHDLTGAPVVLVGTEGLGRRLGRHPQLARRVSQVVSFGPCDAADAARAAAGLCEVGVDAGLVARMHRRTRGNIGHMTVALARFESLARENGWPAWTRRSGATGRCFWATGGRRRDGRGDLQGQAGGAVRQAAVVVASHRVVPRRRHVQGAVRRHPGRGHEVGLPVMVKVGAGEYRWDEGAGLDPAAVLELGPMIGRLAKDYAKKTACVRVEPDDLKQAGFLGALNAARTYRPDKGMAFASWASLRARDEMRSLVRPQVCLTLDMPICEDGATLADTLEDPAGPHGVGELAADDALAMLCRLDDAGAETLGRRFGWGGYEGADWAEMAAEAGETKAAMMGRVKRALDRARAGRAKLGPWGASKAKRKERKGGAA
jgi:DNA-directed RNA polymerase specialized sigma24 family protein